MTDDHSTTDLTAPEPIQEILLTMNDEELQVLSQDLRDEYELIHAEAADGSLFAPSSHPPSPAAVRAAGLCRDIADILAGAR